MDAEATLEKLKKLDEEHKSLMDENDTLIDEQVRVLEATIEEYKPLMGFYSKQFIFTHSTLQLRSYKGPILGRHEEYLIVYDVFEEEVQYLDMDDRTEFKAKNVRSVVKDGHFLDAIRGIYYLEIMLEEYVESFKEENARLNKDLEQALKTS